MTNRAETGVMQFEKDWPGVFIRGDEALSYANQLQILLDGLESRARLGNISEQEIGAWEKLKGFVELLESCRAADLPS